MSKLTLLGIATQPKYDDDDRWTGAGIFANIEVEAEENGQTALHRVYINISVSPTLLKSVSDFGYNETIEEFLMKRVGAGLKTCTTKWPGTEKDAEIIYDVMRLKMQRFVSKSIEHTFYSWRAETGEISEYTEDMLDRNVKHSPAG